jgi:hypothetical protein
MSHTPGPWTVDDDTLDILAVTIGDAPAYIACQPAYPSGRPLAEEELLANLRLICAAPELLAALIRMDEEFGTQNYTKSADDAVIMAQAAIKKATGVE